MSTIQTPFPYQGSKLKEKKRISSIIPHNVAICEPFFGSGFITGHFGKDGSCIANELHDDVYYIWWFASHFPNQFFSLIADYCSEDNRHAEYYYERREEYNVMWRNHDYNICRAALFYYLLSSCHSAMIRYSSKGFNTPFKLFLANGREYKIEQRIQVMKNFIAKIGYIANENALKFLQRNHDIDVIYCDPPYINCSNDYASGWNYDNYLELLDLLRYQYDKYNTPSIVSNFRDDSLTGKFDNVIEFDSWRMSATSPKKRSDVLGLIGLKID